MGIWDGKTKIKTKVALSFVGMFLSFALLIIVCIFLESEIINPAHSAVYLTIYMILIFASVFYFGKVDYMIQGYINAENADMNSNPYLNNI